MSQVPDPRVFVSVTGFRLRHPVLAPWFWALAVRALAQARAAPGNLRAVARTVDGVHHTLTVWTDRDAMRAFPVPGTSRTCGFEAAGAPG